MSLNTVFVVLVVAASTGIVLLTVYVIRLLIEDRRADREYDALTGRHADRKRRVTFRARYESFMTPRWGVRKPPVWRRFLAWCDRPLHVPAPVAVVLTAPPAGAGTPNLPSPGEAHELASGVLPVVRAGELNVAALQTAQTPAGAATVPARARAENAPGRRAFDPGPRGDTQLQANAKPGLELELHHRIDYLAEHIAAAWETVATPMQRQLLWQAHAQPEWDGIEHLQPAWQDATDSFAAFVEAGVA